MPTSKIDFRVDSNGKVWQIVIKKIADDFAIKRFEVGSIKELPIEYQNEKMVSGSVSLDWQLYLFDTDWNLNNLEKFYPDGTESVYYDMSKELHDKYQQELAEKRSRRK